MDECKECAIIAEGSRVTLNDYVKLRQQYEEASDQGERSRLESALEAAAQRRLEWAQLRKRHKSETGHSSMSPEGGS